MKTLKITLLGLALGLLSCEKVIIQPMPGGNDDQPILCTQEISRSDFEYIKEKINQEPFKDSKLERGLNLTENQCFITPQVIELLELYSFRDDKLTMAKHLYHYTIDQHYYYDVVDVLPYKSDRDELIRYIENH